MKKDKKDLKEVGKKIEEAMGTLEKQLDEKVMPKIKGMEMPILVAIVVMLLSALSLKMVIFGVVVLAILLSPKYMDKLMNSSKPEKKSKKSDVVETTAKNVEVKGAKEKDLSSDDKKEESEKK